MSRGPCVLQAGQFGQISPSLSPKHLTNAFGNFASPSFCRLRWEFHLLLGFVARKRWLHVSGGCTARHPWGGYCCFRTLGMDGSQCRTARARRCLHRPDIVREWSPFLDASEPPCFAAALRANSRPRCERSKCWCCCRRASQSELDERNRIASAKSRRVRRTDDQGVGAREYRQK